MTTIEQFPYDIDSNVTIHPPKKIVIGYVINKGWYITINNSPLKDPLAKYTTSNDVRYWDNAEGPLNYLIDHDLVVTKAYKRLDDAVKKVAKSKKQI